MLREWRIQLVVGDSGEPREFFVNAEVLPRFTADGDVRGITACISDVTSRVTERRAVRERAVETEHRYEKARDVIAALQRALRPRGLPVLPGVRIAGSHLLADADSAAGGDWFDALPLPDGWVGLVVGGRGRPQGLRVGDRGGSAGR